MTGIIEMAAPAVGVIASLAALVYGFPIWALTYVILALGTYAYVNA